MPCNVRRRSQSRAHESVDRLVHVGIGHDDHVVLGAAQRLAALSCRRGRLKDVAREPGSIPRSLRRNVG